MRSISLQILANKFGYGQTNLLFFLYTTSEEKEYYEALFLSYRPRKKCNISQFFKKNRQVQKSDRINSDRQSGSDQLGSNKKIKIKYNWTRINSNHKKNNSDYKKKNKISRYHSTFTRHFVLLLRTRGCVN